MARLFKYTAEQIDNYFKKWVTEFLPTQYYIKSELIKSGERAGEQADIKIAKPPTVQGFCLFIDCNKQTFYDLMNKESGNVNSKLSDSITRVHDYIQDYQVGGAINGLYNPMLVARINGIRETIDVNNAVTVQALPTTISNNIIDLTDYNLNLIE